GKRRLSPSLHLAVSPSAVGAFRLPTSSFILHHSSFIVHRSALHPFPRFPPSPREAPRESLEPLSPHELTSLQAAKFPFQKIKKGKCRRLPGYWSLVTFSCPRTLSPVTCLLAPDNSQLTTDNGQLTYLLK